MAKTVDDSILDAAIAVIKTATQLCICNAQPTTYSEATTTADGGANKFCLGKKTGLTSGSFTGPVDGDVSGRKVTKNAETGITVDYSGNTIYAALCSGSVLLYVTTITSQAVTIGNTINTPAFKVEFTDPS